MLCSICGKEKMWLLFIGKDNVCTNCVAKHTVFTEVKNSNEIMLRKALRTLDINSFDDLKKVTPEQVDDLALGAIKSKNPKPTLKLKKNAKSSVQVDTDDLLDPMTEQDQFW